jgi:hypothetical protein
MPAPEHADHVVAKDLHGQSLGRGVAGQRDAVTASHHSSLGDSQRNTPPLQKSKDAIC